jgi:hypothetical protein
MTDVLALPPRRTLNGKFDAYCHVCWNAVYVLLIDDEDPAGRCHSGHARATDCPDALGRARLSATLARLRREGVLPPLNSDGRQSNPIPRKHDPL